MQVVTMKSQTRNQDTKAGNIVHESPKSHLIKTENKYNTTEALDKLLFRRQHEFKAGSFFAASSFRACSDQTKHNIISAYHHII